MKICGFILTRESAWLIWTRVVGIAGLIVGGSINPASLGLSEKQAHVLMGVSAAVLAVGAQLSSSPLPGQKNVEKATDAKP